MNSVANNTGYVSFVDPNVFQLQQQILGRKQQQYDTGYALGLDMADKYGSLPVDPIDVGARNKVLDQYLSGVDDMVKERYQGDWGRAAKEVARSVTQIKQDPIWNTMDYAKRQRAAAQELKARYGPNALGFNDPTGLSVLDEKGNLRPQEAFNLDIQERGDRVGVMNKIWNELSPVDLSNTHYTTRNINGQQITVLVDGTGKEISEKLIKDTKDQMMSVYRNTPEYKQTVREYTELNGMTPEQAEAQIDKEFLDVGLTKKMRQYGENERPIDLSQYAGQAGMTAGDISRSYSSSYDIPEMEAGKELAKKALQGLSVGAPPNIDPNTPEGRYAEDILLSLGAYDAYSPTTIGTTVAKTVDEKYAKLVPPEIFGELAIGAEQAARTASQNTPMIPQSGISPEEVASKSYLSERLKQINPELTDREIRRLSNDILKGSAAASKIVKKGLETKFDDAVSKLGSTEMEFYSGNPFSKAGNKFNQNLADLESQVFSSPSNYTFLEGDFAGDKYQKNEADNLTKAYKENKTSPKWKGFGFSPTLGIVGAIADPNGKVNMARLNGVYSDLMHDMVISAGKPEALASEILSKLKTGMTLPATSFKFSKGIKDGQHTKYLYRGDVRDKDYVTNGDIKGLNGYYSAIGKPDRMLELSPDVKDTDPYDFNNPIDLIVTAELLESKIKK